VASRRESPIRKQSVPNSPGKENPSGGINREKAAHGSNDQGSKHIPRSKLHSHKDSTTIKVTEEMTDIRLTASPLVLKNPQNNDS
jgi:hypothetical protein